MGAVEQALAFAAAAPARLPPELACFADEPRQMASGMPGKSGYLRLGFERRGGKTVLADLRARVPYLAQRALHFDDAMPDLAHVFLITTSGCVLQGDRMALDVTLAAGARAHVTSQSATKVHSMDANYATQAQTLVLGEDAYLEYLPEPLIPHRASRFASDTRIVIAPSASLVCAEIVQPGRRHHHPDECFGMTVLSLATRATRPDGRVLFAENLVVEPGRQMLRQPGVMEGFDVFGNVFVCTAASNAERILARLEARVDLAAGVALGACRLPNDAGLVFKAAGRETAQVKDAVRDLWRVAREEITGATLAPRQFWR